MSDQIPTVAASAALEIFITCPHCGDYQDRQEELAPALDFDLFTSGGIVECEVSLNCETCGWEFIVNQIHV